MDLVGLEPLRPHMLVLSVLAIYCFGNWWYHMVMWETNRYYRRDNMVTHHQWQQARWLLATILVVVSGWLMPPATMICS